MIHEFKEAIDEDLSVSGRRSQLAESLLGWTGVCERPSTDRYPRLQPIVFVLQSSEPTIQAHRIGIHGHNLKAARIEESESEVDMGISREIEVLGFH